MFVAGPAWLNGLPQQVILSAPLVLLKAEASHSPITLFVASSQWSEDATFQPIPPRTSIRRDLFGSTMKKKSENVVNKLLPVLSQVLRGWQVTSLVLPPVPTKNREAWVASKDSEIGVGGGPCKVGSVGFSHHSILYEYFLRS